MCLLFSAASEGRIRNLGLGGKIGTFLGPFWYFGPIWDQVPNSGPYRSACAPGKDYEIYVPPALLVLLGNNWTSVFDGNYVKEGFMLCSGFLAVNKSVKQSARESVCCTRGTELGTEQICSSGRGTALLGAI